MILVKKKSVLLQSQSKRRSGSSVWLEYMPVTHGVASSSLVRTAKQKSSLSGLFYYIVMKYPAFFYSKRFSIWRKWMWVFILTIVCGSCQKEKTQSMPRWQPTAYEWQIPRYFPTQLHLPNDNPMTEEGVALGRCLFYDNRLSKNGEMCCATCHVQAAGFDVGGNNSHLVNGQPIGVNGTPTPHNALPLVNVVFNANGYGWNGGIYANNPNVYSRQIEDIVKMAFEDPNELDITSEQVVSILRANATYRSMFYAAFGSEEVTMSKVQKAIAQFVRTFLSGNSKFDSYLRGETQLSDAEWRGYVLFTTEEGADCFHCHGGAGTPLFTTNMFYNNALDEHPQGEDSHYAITGAMADWGSYRAPTLRNIAVSAPYMHDGRYSTLDEVLQFYNSGLHYSTYVHPLMHKIGDGGACLTPNQLADLKAFLMTLTDEEFLTNQKFSAPLSMP